MFSFMPGCSITGFERMDTQEQNNANATQKMQTHISLKLYATLKLFMPSSGEKYPIEPGTTVHDLLKLLNLPEEKAKLIFIDGRQADLATKLQGGERVGIFPPVGGG